MERTREQILDEAVYAVASVVAHYGPGFNKTGLAEVRKLLEQMGSSFRTDACYRVDVYEDSKYVDHHERIICPKGWWVPTFEEVQNMQQEVV